MDSCPHLQLQTCQPGACDLHQLAAGGSGPSEADCSHVSRFSQCLPNDTAAPHHEIEGAGRKTRAADDFRQSPGAAGYQVSWLEHNAVPVGECRRDLPGRNGDGEVPRRDDAHHANRLTKNVDLDAWSDRLQVFAGDPERLSGEELEDMPGATRFRDRLGQHLTFFPGQQPSEFLSSGEYLGTDTIKGFSASLRTNGNPLRLCLHGGLDCQLRLLKVGLCIQPDQVGNVRGVQVLAHVRPCAPGPVNEVLMHSQCSTRGDVRPQGAARIGLPTNALLGDALAD